MNITIDQLIFKYKLLKNDFIDNEKFHEAKIIKEVLEDLTKLKSVMDKQKI